MNPENKLKELKHKKVYIMISLKSSRQNESVMLRIKQQLLKYLWSSKRYNVLYLELSNTDVCVYI
jgi:hypothetical protein